LYHDKDGMALPASIAPFEVVVTPVNIHDGGQAAAAERLMQDCKSAGLDVVLDDRDERPGVKFKDNDLTGIPYRITVGKKLVQGMVEIVERRTKQTADVPLEQAAEYVRSRVKCA
jgi:prolyl-tRNA synthetase